MTTTYRDTPVAGVESVALVRAGELTGRTIVAIDGERIGSIDDLYLDTGELALRYVTVDVGGFLGIGARRVLVPVELLDWDGENLVLPVDREVIERAPEFDPAVARDRDDEERIARSWGIDPYWRSTGYAHAEPRRGDPRIL